MNKHLQSIILNLGFITGVISRLSNMIPGERAKEVEKMLNKYTDVFNAISVDIAEINKSITSTEDKNNENIENKPQV